MITQISQIQEVFMDKAIQELERNVCLVVQFTVVIKAHAGCEGAVGRSRNAELVHHICGFDARKPGVPGNSRQTGRQEIKQATLALHGKDDATGRYAVAHGQHARIVGVVHGRRL